MCLLDALSGPGIDRPGADAADGGVLDRLSSGDTSTAVRRALAEPVGTVKTRIRTGMIRLRDSLTRMVTVAGP